MSLISVEEWPKMLWANTDAQGNMWFERSDMDAPKLLHMYTVEELLKEWKPVRRH